MNRFLAFGSLALTLGLSLVMTPDSALAHGRDLEERPVFDLQAGGTFTLRQDIYIDRGNTAAVLDDSRTDLIGRCYLQAYFPKNNDRVVRAGRTLTLKRVTLAPTFVAFSIDDGLNPRVLAQVGCNLLYPGAVPLVKDVRLALESAFDLDFQDAPVEEVGAPPRDDRRPSPDDRNDDRNDDRKDEDRRPPTQDRPPVQDRPPTQDRPSEGDVKPSLPQPAPKPTPKPVKPTATIKPAPKPIPKPVPKPAAPKPAAPKPRPVPQAPADADNSPIAAPPIEDVN